MAEILLGGKRLSELKVTELKEELDSRGLSKKGVKTVLITRLKNAILKEELESNANNDNDSQVEEGTADSSMDQSQLDESIAATPPPTVAVVETTPPPLEQEQPTEDPLASTPTAAATTDTELANQLVDEQSHDTPATLPSNGASLEEERQTPLLDEPQGQQDFIPLGGFDEESMESGGQEVGVAPEDQSADKERRESVVIDPSYSPEGEELLYEGDLEAGAASKDGNEGNKDGVKEGEETKEDGFIVDLHDTSMELEIAPRKKQASAPTESVEPTTSTAADKKSTSLSSECHLWVKGLSPSVRALDLQTLFSTFGKVVTAKVVAKAQSRNQRFGYVTMTTAEEAQKCISELNDTELKGRKITVEVAKNPPALGGPSPKAPPTASPHSKKESPKSSPRLVRKSQDKGSEVKPARKSLESGTGRKSPKLPVRSRSRSRERARMRRHSPPPPRRSPPMRRSPPPRRFRSPSPPFREPVRNRLGPRPPMPGDRREVSMRRDMEREHMVREAQRQVEMRLQERREREQEMAMRRRMEAERARQQQEMERRMAEVREREAREREARERQAVERERMFRERERELRDREVRERQRREALEKQLREREMREQEFREREKRMKEAWERELQSKELKAMREKEREARLQNERETQIHERERKLKEEADRIESARRMQREEAAKLAREREEVERERKLAEEKKRKQEEEMRAKREEEKRSVARAQSSVSQRGPPPSARAPPANRATPTSGRLGKRSYDDGNMESGGSKRPSLGDSNYQGSQGSSVFGRLDPPPKREGVGNQGDLYRRGNEGFERQSGYSGGLRYGNEGRGGSSYQQSTSQSAAAALFSKPAPASSSMGRKPEGMSLAGVTPEVMTAAAQVLQNINKQVGLRNLPMTNPNPQGNVASQLHQIAAANPISQGYESSFGGGFGGGTSFMGGNKKLPPEGERYNRRMAGGGRSGGQYGMMRGGNPFKGGRM